MKKTENRERLLQYFNCLAMLIAIVIYWLVFSRYEVMLSVEYLAVIVFVTSAIFIIIYFVFKNLYYENNKAISIFSVLSLVFIFETIYIAVKIISFSSYSTLLSIICTQDALFWSFSSIFQGFSALLALFAGLMLVFVGKPSYKKFISQFFSSFIWIGCTISISLIFLPLSTFIVTNRDFMAAALIFTITLAIISISSLIIQLFRLFKK